MALVGDQMRATTYGGNGIFVETNQYIFPLSPNKTKGPLRETLLGTINGNMH
jgi:hypothetical protein